MAERGLYPRPEGLYPARTVALDERIFHIATPLASLLASPLVTFQRRGQTPDRSERRPISQPFPLGCTADTGPLLSQHCPAFERVALCSPVPPSDWTAHQLLPCWPHQALCPAGQLHDGKSGHPVGRACFRVKEAASQQLDLSQGTARRLLSSRRVRLRMLLGGIDPRRAMCTRTSYQARSLTVPGGKEPMRKNHRHRPA